MATSLAIIILLGLLANRLFEKLKLPSLLGMILVGALIAPYGFKVLSDEILTASADLRKIALIVILLLTGLGINKKDFILIVQ
jgi:NhaP-type Na+/H+ or K+/H+ antiporter